MGSVVPLSAHRRKSEAMGAYMPLRRTLSVSAEIVILPVIRIERTATIEAEPNRASS